MHYYQLDVAYLTPSKLREITQTTLHARPEEFQHVSYSPMCETLSKADRKRTRHFTCQGHPHSELACYHMQCLTRVMETLRRTYTDPTRTMITCENPVGRFKDLRLIQSIQRRPGWRMHTADHCMMRNHLDGARIFPKKPTTWLVFGDMPELVDKPRCDGSCACVIFPVRMGIAS